MSEVKEATIKIIDWCEAVDLPRGDRLADRLDTQKAKEYQDRLNAIKDPEVARDKAERLIGKLNEKVRKKGLLGLYCRVYGRDVIQPEISWLEAWNDEDIHRPPRRITLRARDKLAENASEEEYDVNRGGTIEPFVEGEFNGFAVFVTKKGYPRICYDVVFDEIDYKTCEIALHALGKVKKSHLDFVEDVSRDRIEAALSKILGIKDIEARGQILRIDHLLSSDQHRPMVLFHEIEEMVKDITTRFDRIVHHKAALDSLASLIEHYMVKDIGMTYSITASASIKNTVEQGRHTIELLDATDIVGEVHGVVIMPSIATIEQETSDEFAPYLVVASEIDLNNPGDDSPTLVPFSALEELHVA